MGCEQSRLGRCVGDKVEYCFNSDIIGRVTAIEDDNTIWVEYDFYGKHRPSGIFHASCWKTIESVNPLEVL